MGFILIAIGLIMYGLLSIYLHGENELNLLSTILGVIVIFICTILALVEPDKSCFIKQYNSTKSKIEVYRNSTIDDYNFLSEIVRDINNVNSKIESNKEYANTFWLGLYYDTEIGNYKKLNVDDLKK